MFTKRCTLRQTTCRYAVVDVPDASWNSRKEFHLHELGRLYLPKKFRNILIQLSFLFCFAIVKPNMYIEPYLLENRDTQ